MSFSLFFKPKHKYFLERLGKENDGGYLINSEAIIKSDYLLSFGIFDDWSFEKNFIIPNSSFAWWAAWLSEKNDKVIIVPEKWSGLINQKFIDIIPQNWIKIKF